MRWSAVIACLVALGLSTTGARGDAPTARVGADAMGDLRLDITSYGPNVLEPGLPLVVGATISNDAIEEATELALAVDLTAQPLASRDDIARWAAGESSPELREAVRRTVAGGALPARTSREVTAVVGAKSLGLGAQPWAVYGVRIRLEEEGETVRTVRTFLTFLAREPAATPVAVIATVTGSAARVDALLSASSDPRVTLLADPVALANPDVTIRPDASRDLYALPAGHVDVASLARADDSTLLPRALAAARSAETHAAGAPWIAVLPSLDERAARTARDQGAVAVLVQPLAGLSAPEIAGYRGSVPPGVGDAEAAGDRPAIPVIVPDSRLSSALAGTVTAAALRPARVVADSALLSQAAGDTLVVVSPGTSWVVDGDHRSAALDALAACPWIDLIDLSQALDAPRSATVEAPDLAPVDTDIAGSVVGRAATALTGLDHLALATVDPPSVYAGPASSVFSALSFEGRADPAARAEAIDAALGGVQEVLDAVGLPEGSALNLISSSGNVPVTVTNDLDVDIAVMVVLESRSPNLRVRDAPTVTIPAHTSQQALVPVTAVSSANVSALVRLEDAEGHRLTPDTGVRVRVRADWGAAFTAILGGVALLLFVGGIWRTVRRGRGNTRAAPGTVEPAVRDDG